MAITIRTTYQTVTPESTEYGDYADQGFIDEEGTEYAFRELVELLRPCIHSGNDWATHYEWYTDYRTGSVESRSYHPVSKRDKRYFQKAAKAAGIF